MVAEYHNRITAEKTGAAQRRAAEQGVPPMSLPPGLVREIVGTDKHGKPIRGPVIKTKDAEAVAQAVILRAKGARIADVREHLATQGIKRSYHGTQSLLASPLLCGRFLFGKDRRADEQLTGAIPKIVDEAIWKAAQEVAVPRGRRPTSDRLLARLGLLRCSTCDSRMVVGTQRQNGRSYAFYRCASVREDCERRVTIGAQIAEAVVIEAVHVHLEGAVGRKTAPDTTATPAWTLCAQPRHARRRPGRSRTSLTSRPSSTA